MRELLEWDIKIIVFLLDSYEDSIDGDNLELMRLLQKRVKLAAELEGSCAQEHFSLLRPLWWDRVLKSSLAVPMSYLEDVLSDLERRYQQNFYPIVTNYYKSSYH